MSQIQDSVLTKDQKQIKQLKKKLQLMKKMLDDTMIEFNKINENVNVTQKIYIEISNIVKTIKTKEKKQLSTQSQSSFSIDETESLGKNKQIDKDCIYVSLKKLEEIENSYNEMTRNFLILTSKYKIMKNENIYFDQLIHTQKLEICNLDNSYTKLKHELNESNISVLRLKEINKCIVDISLANFDKDELVSLNNDNNVVYINAGVEIKNKEKYSEPMPSFFKFLSS
jgi:hypothetical protein